MSALHGVIWGADRPLNDLYAANGVASTRRPSVPEQHSPAPFTAANVLVRPAPCC